MTYSDRERNRFTPPVVIAKSLRRGEGYIVRNNKNNFRKVEPKMKKESSNIQTARPIVTRKRIGSTTYEVRSYFNPQAKETVEEKLLRIIKNDLTFRQNRGIIDMSQTAGLSERSSA
jgi:hypothetical protein